MSRFWPVLFSQWHGQGQRVSFFASVPTTPDPNTSATASRYKGEPYHDTNWSCICSFLPREGHRRPKSIRQYCAKGSPPQTPWRLFGVYVFSFFFLLFPFEPSLFFLLFPFEPSFLVNTKPLFCLLTRGKTPWVATACADCPGFGPGFCPWPGFRPRLGASGCASGLAFCFTGPWTFLGSAARSSPTTRAKTGRTAHVLQHRGAHTDWCTWAFRAENTFGVYFFLSEDILVQKYRHSLDGPAIRNPNDPGECLTPLVLTPW